MGSTVKTIPEDAETTNECTRIIHVNGKEMHVTLVHDSDMVYSDYIKAMDVMKDMFYNDLLTIRAPSHKIDV